MSYQQLFIWVEGPDDKRFIESIIIPCLKKKYERINIIEYAQKKTKFIENFLKSIKSMKADYIYLADIDNVACITQKKEIIKQQIKNIDESSIIIVCQEIESWYYAGLNEEAFKTLGIKKPSKYKNTDNLIKEQFDQSIPKKFENSRVDFMIEVLKLYNLNTVINKESNQYLLYFMNKYHIS